MHGIEKNEWKIQFNRELCIHRDMSYALALIAKLAFIYAIHKAPRVSMSCSCPYAFIGTKYDLSCFVI